MDVPRTLPRGPHGLPGEVVAGSQRSRLAEAVAQAVDEKGYAATTVADIVGRVGVSRTGSRERPSPGPIPRAARYKRIPFGRKRVP